eukprot:gene35697-44022_t
MEQNAFRATPEYLKATEVLRDPSNSISLTRYNKTQVASNSRRYATVHKVVETIILSNDLWAQAVMATPSDVSAVDVFTAAEQQVAMDSRSAVIQGLCGGAKRSREGNQCSSGSKRSKSLSSIDLIVEDEQKLHNFRELRLSASDEMKTMESVSNGFNAEELDLSAKAAESILEEAAQTVSIYEQKIAMIGLSKLKMIAKDNAPVVEQRDNVSQVEHVGRTDVSVVDEHVTTEEGVITERVKVIATEFCDKIRSEALESLVEGEALCNQQKVKADAAVRDDLDGAMTAYSTEMVAKQSLLVDLVKTFQHLMSEIFEMHEKLNASETEKMRDNLKQKETECLLQVEIVSVTITNQFLNSAPLTTKTFAVFVWRDFPQHQANTSQRQLVEGAAGPGTLPANCNVRDLVEPLQVAENLWWVPSKLTDETALPDVDPFALARRARHSDAAYNVTITKTGESRLLPSTLVTGSEIVVRSEEWIDMSPALRDHISGRVAYGFLKFLKHHMNLHPTKYVSKKWVVILDKLKADLRRCNSFEKFHDELLSTENDQRTEAFLMGLFVCSVVGDIEGDRAMFAKFKSRHAEGAYIHKLFSPLMPLFFYDDVVTGFSTCNFLKTGLLGLSFLLDSRIATHLKAVWKTGWVSWKRDAPLHTLHGWSYQFSGLEENPPPQCFEHNPVFDEAGMICLMNDLLKVKNHVVPASIYVEESESVVTDPSQTSLTAVPLVETSTTSAPVAPPPVANGSSQTGPLAVPVAATSTTSAPVAPPPVANGSSQTGPLAVPVAATSPTS